MLEKLKKIEQRLEDVQRRLGDPAVYADRELLTKLSREQKELEPVVAAYRAYLRAESDYQDALELLSDPEMKEFAQEEISEIESIGDACYNMARAINRKFRSKEDFTEEQYAHISHIMELCDTAMTHMLNIIEDASIDANRALNFENEINDYRKLLKKKNVDDIDAKLYSYQMGVHYMDIVNDCEKLGDYIINVVEARMGVRQK